MPKLVKDSVLTAHTWLTLRSDEDIQNTDFSQGQWLVPVSEFEALKSLYPNANLGILASADTDVERLKALSIDVPVIAIDFPVFMDGRGFSQARSLREHVDYQGEIRAVGHFIHDQIFYLSRCGFNSFEFSDDVDIEPIQDYLSTFSESYQAGTDEPQPLFRRRA